MAKGGAAAKKKADAGKGDAGKLKPTVSVKARHIFCEKKSKLDEAEAQLKQGVAFNKVAEQFSEDKAKQGGSLGFVNRNTQDPAFEAVVFDLPESKVDAPNYRYVKTAHGHHLIMVEERK